MPKYRKLHVKIVESFDLNEMPNDTYRLFWVILPTQLCREGRGLNNLAWLKSRVFPLREDISLADIANMMNWYHEHDMIVEYEVNNRLYFHVPTFRKYQGDCSKEAESNFPSPPEEVSRELVGSRSREDLIELEVTESESESESESKLNSEIDSFLKHWKKLFPDKPQPRVKTILAKFKTRIKEKYFYDNWLKALGKASESTFLKESGFFTAPWFLKNDEYWERCLDGNYANGLDPQQQKVKSNREVITRVAQEYVNDKS